MCTLGFTRNSEYLHYLKPVKPPHHLCRMIVFVIILMTFESMYCGYATSLFVTTLSRLENTYSFDLYTCLVTHVAPKDFLEYIPRMNQSKLRIIN